ncbi:GNAT family N-acetyltransferase [Ketogulonicigenium vulgare]|uniref:Acetyltransferase, GNAT family protein n=1 Tax=Ketogulonicigenium vulgare (strain WSH-001) TaxID=759362 RepID=F9Y8W2_KETVW|nr:GNAT family N-acetyltransferase [Ketogulonicigenium vulgare]ADO41785.1 IAA acetyltransferase [Ketogulonicigenium vulgare Y25]AEM40018.1 Acetyltransferase, GNAT family protein [Ketogulonicigenium vulgare WSH-001]ALJ80222.1 GNAT family acetyltransferase [Ketogulonicigenium vulgare]ANW33082.1 GNAT family acetyltransferase [Ketogulonicigenium vulgare]AOZ53715.1 IAA acetyltransferase [Ketogulonicigenium vulgare]
MIAISIRKADPLSADGRRLLTASQNYLRSLYPPEDNYFLPIEALAADPAITFLMAYDDTGALGCVALADKGEYGEVKSLWVDPNTRGKSVGAALMETLEGRARARKLKMLKLETGDTLHAAHRLYKRVGYTICGPFGDYAEGPHSVFMEKTLS